MKGVRTLRNKCAKKSNRAALAGLPVGQSDGLTRTRALPEQSEQIGSGEQRFQVCEQEQPLSAFKLATGFDQMVEAVGTRGDGQDAEAMESEMFPMQFLKPRRFVGEQFSVK